jgi:crossover junction endodeoxyribonuclease RuvC
MADKAGIVVLGLDPGFSCTGFGVVREVSGVLELLQAGTIRSGTAHELGERLGRIFTGVAEVVGRHQPEVAAVEDIFVARGPASALKLGQARGAAVAACAVAGLHVASYEPARVKQALVGQGRADKEQVAFMVGRLLGEKPTWAKDASDALAVAICHLNQRRLARMTART